MSKKLELHAYSTEQQEAALEQLLTWRHNLLRDTLSNKARQVGLTTLVEPSELDEHSKKRPEIEAIYKWLLDVTSLSLQQQNRIRTNTIPHSQQEDKQLDTRQSTTSRSPLTTTR